MYLCDYCGNETSHKASTVKEHVEAERGNLACFKTQQKRARIELLPVRDEAEGVGEHTGSGEEEARPAENKKHRRKVNHPSTDISC